MGWDPFSTSDLSSGIIFLSGILVHCLLLNQKLLSFFLPPPKKNGILICHFFLLFFSHQPITSNVFVIIVRACVRIFGPL